MVRTLTGLQAADDTADEALRGVRLGKMVTVEVVQTRNVRHHQLYWVMVTKIARAVDLPPDYVSHILKLRTGYTTPVKLRDGTIAQVPRSIAFSAMDQATFREFFDSCCREICLEWLPHMSMKQVRTEVLSMMGIDWKEPDDGGTPHPDGSRGHSADDGDQSHQTPQEAGHQT